MKLSLDRIIISYNNKTELIIRKTVIGQLIVIGWTLLSIIIGGIFISTMEHIGKFELIIILAILASILYSAYKPLKTIISKEQFSFDLPTETVYKNQKSIVTFGDIEFIEIIKIGGGDGGNDGYLLNLRLKDRSSIQIDENPNKTETRKVAGEIASFINKEIRSK